MPDNKFLDLAGLGIFKEKMSAEVDADVTAATNFVNANATTLDVGGVKKGTSFADGITVLNLLNNILYPYVAFTGLSAAATSNNGGVKEIGTSYTITAVKVTYTAGSVTPTQLDILNTDGSVNTTVTSNITSGIVVTLATPVTITSGTGQLTAKLTDGTTTRNATTGQFTWITPFFRGTTSKTADEMTASDILGGTKDATAKGVKTYAYSMSNNRAWIAYPSSYGRIKTILDPNNFDVTAGFGEPATVSVESTNPAWGPVSYFVYCKLEPATTTDFNLKFTLN